MTGLWGLVPLLLYIVLCFLPFGQIFAVLAGLIAAAVMGGHGLMDLAAGIREGLGSFLGYIGFIILLGGGLGQVLKETGVVHWLVRFLTGRVRINSPRKAMAVTMVTSVVIVSVLGTMAGGNAVIAPLLIPLVASVGLVPNAMAVLLHGAGATGLFLGPFTPPVVALMELTGLSYPRYLLHAGLPLSLIMWGVTFFWAGRVQRRYQGQTAYENTDLEESVLPKGAGRATAGFVITLVALMAWGIAQGGGSTFVLALMTVTGAVTGALAGFGPSRIIGCFCEGAKGLVWLFFFFVLLDPFINFLTDAGAFSALAGVLEPYVKSSGPLFFLLVTTVIGVFGVPGAAVAQAQVLHTLFASLALAQGVPMSVWVIVLLVGSQMTSFAIPEGDMQGQMGLARSDDLKSVLVNGWLIVGASLIYVLLRGLLL